MTDLTVQKVVPLAAAWLLLVPADSAPGQVLFEDFNDNSTSVLWAPVVVGTGPTVTEANERVGVTLPPGSVDAPVPVPGVAPVFGAGYVLNPLLRGDFDIQVDFELVDWPPANGSQIQLVTFDFAANQTAAAVQLSGAGYSFGTVSVPAGALSGKLRLVRIGATASGFFFDGASWVSLGSVPVTTSDLAAFVGLGSSEAVFGGELVSAGFDNFAVNQGELIWGSAEVSPGPGQTAEAGGGVSVTFGEVTSPGTVSTAVFVAQPDGELPANFRVFDLPLFFDISTTATVSPPIQVCLSYFDVNPEDGFVDATTPPIDENTLKVLHEEAGVFVDRTASRDPVNNTVCAEVQSLSQFVLGAGEAPADAREAVAELCPCAGAPEGGGWRNHGRYVRCVARAAKEFKRGGFLTRDERRGLVRSAARSTCGRPGRTRCCVTRGRRISCRIKRQDRCAKRGGSDAGDGSCLPDPFLRSALSKRRVGIWTWAGLRAASRSEAYPPVPTTS